MRTASFLTGLSPASSSADRLVRMVFEEIASPYLASGNALLDALCLTVTWPAGRGVEADGAEERRRCGDKLM
jgi:hypothetical protein